MPCAAGFETQDAGIVAKLLVEDGTKDIAVGMPVAVLVDSADDVPAFASYTAAAGGAPTGGAPKPSATGQSSGAAAAAEGAPDSPPRSAKMGPAARMALENASLSASDVRPTGPQGIITKGDVLAAIASGAAPKARHAAQARAASQAEPAAASASPSPPPARSAPAAASTAAAADSAPLTSPRVRRGERYTDVPVSNMRRVIAKRLLQSKVETPAVYVTGGASLNALSSLRGALKAAGVKVSVNDFVIKAVGKALRAVPGACAGWDAKAERIQRFERVDVSVATEGGLITPIITDADIKSVQEVGKAMKDLAGTPGSPSRARFMLDALPRLSQVVPLSHSAVHPRRTSSNPPGCPGSTARSWLISQQLSLRVRDCSCMA
jgi:pyruvate dehydrogenase E2 component (dihydrolipoamide acetyltransferase)